MSDRQGITLSADQVELMGEAVKLLLATVMETNKAGKRKMLLKQQRAIFASANEIINQLEDAGSMRRYLELWKKDPGFAVEMAHMWGEA